MATATMKGLGNDNHCTYHSIDSSSSNRNTYGLLNDYLFFATLYFMCLMPLIFLDAKLANVFVVVGHGKAVLARLSGAN